MKRFTIQPIKPLLCAWKRLGFRRGEKRADAARGSAKQAQATKPHHRHFAFLELP